MLIEPTLDRLNELGLTGMAHAFAEQLGVPDMQSISFEDRLALLLERESSERETRRLRRLLQIAKLRLDASLEDIDFRSPRGLDKSVMLRLAGCDWIPQHQVVLITGPPVLARPTSGVPSPKRPAVTACQPDTSGSPGSSTTSL